MYEFEIIARLQHFWKILYENTISRTTLPSGQDEENYRRIRQIMSYIAEHYSEKILLNDVAELIHLSPSECSRLFKKCMNITLFGYIQEYRIERSLEYLEDSSCSITESGLLSGFSESNYYTKSLRKDQRLYTKTIQKKTAELMPRWPDHKAQKRCSFYTISQSKHIYPAYIFCISLWQRHPLHYCPLYGTQSLSDVPIAFFIAIPYFTDRIICRSLSASPNAIASLRKCPEVSEASAVFFLYRPPHFRSQEDGKRMKSHKLPESFPDFLFHGV